MTIDLVLHSNEQYDALLDLCPSGFVSDIAEGCKKHVRYYRLLLHQFTERLTSETWYTLQAPLNFQLTSESNPDDSPTLDVLLRLLVRFIPPPPCI